MAKNLSLKISSRLGYIRPKAKPQTGATSVRKIDPEIQRYFLLTFTLGGCLTPQPWRRRRRAPANADNNTQLTVERVTCLILITLKKKKNC